VIKVKLERAPFFFGIGMYISKKTWNITGNGTWFGPSFVVHIVNRIIRICWIISKEDRNDK
jgi:hypothetical protein